MLLILLALENLIAGLLFMAVLIGLVSRIPYRWVLLFPLLLAPLIFVYGPMFAIGVGVTPTTILPNSR